METIQRIKRVVDDVLGYFVGGILLAMAVTIFISVIDRYLGGTAAWVEEVVRAGVVWTTFLGCYVSIAKNKDIKVDIVTARLPKMARAVCELIAELMVMVFVVVFTKYSFSYTIQFASYKLPMTGMTRGLLYAVFPLGSVMMCIHYILSIITRICGLMNGGKPRELSPQQAGGDK